MLVGWINCFITTGTAGETVVGLLFVVVTLGSDLPTSGKPDIAHASLTPVLKSAVLEAQGGSNAAHASARAPQGQVGTGSPQDLAQALQIA